MTNSIQEKLDEILKDLPLDKQEELYNELYAFMCKSIISQLQDSIAGSELSQQQIKTAKEVAEHIAIEDMEEWKIQRYLRCGREFNKRDPGGEFESPLKIITKGDCKMGIKKKS